MTFPSQVLDLRAWKLTLPIGSPGKPTEIKQPDLATYSNTDYCCVPLDGGVRFRAAVNGVSTPNSHNCRSELREMKADGKTLAAWSSTDGLGHTMVQDMAFTRLPAGNAGVGCVGGQVHDADDDIAVWRCESTGLWLALGDHREDWMLIDPGYKVGTRIQTAFVVNEGEIIAYYQGREVHRFDAAIIDSYFRAGAYTQANAGAVPNDSSNYGETIYYGLTVTHGPVPVIAPVGSDPAPSDPPPVVDPIPDPTPAPSAKPPIVILRRHAEKPAGSVKGYAPDGSEDSHSLTKDGWARVRGLVAEFSVPRSDLFRPTRIYAADGPNAGERMKQTVSFLAAELGLTPILRFDKGQEAALAAELKTLPAGEVALVCWEHSEELNIAKGMGTVTPKLASSWPDANFNSLEVLTSTGPGKWSLYETAELILPTDKALGLAGKAVPVGAMPATPPVVTPPPVTDPPPVVIPDPTVPTPDPVPAPVPQPDPAPVPEPSPEPSPSSSWPRWLVDLINAIKRFFGGN